MIPTVFVEVYAESASISYRCQWQRSSRGNRYRCGRCWRGVVVDFASDGAMRTRRACACCGASVRLKILPHAPLSTASA